MARRVARVPQTVIEVRHTPLGPGHWWTVAILVAAMAAAVWYARSEVLEGIDAHDANYLAHQVHRGRYQAASDGLISYARADEPMAHKADVVLLGSSALREALPSDAELSAQFSASTGHAVSAFDLSSSDQTWGEAWLLIDRLGLDPAKTVVLAATPSRIYSPVTLQPGYPVDLLQLGARWRQAIPDAGLLPFSTQVDGTVTSLRTTLRRYVGIWPQNWFRYHVYGIAPAPLPKHWFADLAAGQPQRRARNYTAAMETMNASTHEQQDLNTAVLMSLADRVKQAGARFVFVRAPMLANSDQEFGPERWARYLQVENALRARGVTVLDVNDAAALSPIDFYDFSHVAATGRAKWSSALVAALSLELNPRVHGD